MENFVLGTRRGEIMKDNGDGTSRVASDDGKQTIESNAIRLHLLIHAERV